MDSEMKELLLAMAKEHSSRNVKRILQQIEDRNKIGAECAKEAKIAFLLTIFVCLLGYFAFGIRPKGPETAAAIALLWVAFVIVVGVCRFLFCEGKRKHE